MYIYSYVQLLQLFVFLLRIITRRSEQRRVVIHLRVPTRRTVRKYVYIRYRTYIIIYLGTRAVKKKKKIIKKRFFFACGQTLFATCVWYAVGIGLHCVVRMEKMQTHTRADGGNPNAWRRGRSTRRRNERKRIYACARNKGGCDHAGDETRRVAETWNLSFSSPFFSL